MSSSTLPPPTEPIHEIKDGVVCIPKINASWQSVAQRRREEIVSKIPSEYLLPKSLLQGHNHSHLIEASGLLTPRELSIVSLTATKLLKCVHNGDFTSVEVTLAFCKTSAIAHQAVS